MIATKEFHEKVVNTLVDLRADSLNAIKGLVEEMGNEVIIPSDIFEYDCSNTITYNGGRHPEYNSTICGTIERIVLTPSNSIEVYFEEGGAQELAENSLDDILVVMELLLVIKEDYVEEDTE
jgi:hypothetical protein